MHNTALVLWKRAVGGFFGVFAVEGRETRILLLSGHGAEGNEFGGGGGVTKGHWTEWSEISRGGGQS